MHEVSSLNLKHLLFSHCHDLIYIYTKMTLTNKFCHWNLWISPRAKNQLNWYGKFEKRLIAEVAAEEACVLDRSVAKGNKSLSRREYANIDFLSKHLYKNTAVWACYGALTLRQTFWETIWDKMIDLTLIKNGRPVICD